MEGQQYKEGPQGLSKFTDEGDEPPGPSKVQDDGVQSKAPLVGEGGPPGSLKFTDEGDEPPGPSKVQDYGGQSKALLEGLSRPSEIQSEGDDPPNIDLTVHNSGPYWKCNYP